MDYIFCGLILFYRVLIMDACDSVAQTEMSESASPESLLVDLSKQISRSGSKLNSFFLAEDMDSFYFIQGKIILKKSIDREEYCSKSNKHQTNINKQCCGGQCCIFIGVISNDNSKKKFYVRVKVIDVNDNSPIFSEKIFYKEILENSKINTKIYLPTATDIDEQPFGVESYEIEKPNEYFETYFKLIVEDLSDIKQPILFIKNQIDRELIDRIEFSLIAIDGGKPPRKGKTKIIIKILDENDSEPVFSQSMYEIKVKENEINGQELLHIKVEDKDSGNNGKLTINFASSTSQDIQNIFQLTQTQQGVVLKLISKLDYETISKYSFTLVAKDHGQPPRSSTATVKIQVTNVNDSPPNIMFYQLNKPISKQFARIYVDEGNTKDLVICLVKVTDEDNPAESIICEIETSNEYFYLSSLKTNIVLENKKTFELKSKIDFNREAKILHSVSVVCSDSDGVNQLKQMNKLEVIVRDINDNPPVFSSPHYYGFIKENRVNEAISMKKESILATDRDDGENGTVEYYITEVSDDMKNYFTIDKSTAIVKVIMGLDFEKIQKVSLTITAKDLGTPSLSSTTKLIINIKDTNDNQPEVDTLYYSFDVYENEPMGTFVGKINVSDKDYDVGNKKVIMKIKNIVSGSSYPLEQLPDQIFNIENDSGKIYTKVSLDREKFNQITFSIIASNPNPFDFGTERIDYIRHYRETVDISVSVNILDRNDNSPIMVLKEKQNVKAINPEVSFYTSTSVDNLQDNCVSFPYVFIDPDEGENSRVKVTTKGSNIFSLNTDHGMICAVDKLPAKGHYRILVIAEDGDFNNSRKQEFMVNIFVKEDPNSFTNKHRPNNGNSDLKGNGDPFRNSERHFRNNIIYIIIGSIAAILFLLLIIILVKFRKFLTGERNYPMNTDKNIPDSLECQDFFDCIPDSKYNDLSFAKTTQPENYRSDYQFKSMDSKLNEKYESTDPILHDMRHFNNSTKQMNPSYNYQTIPSQFLPEALHLYHSFGNTKPLNNRSNYNNSNAQIPQTNNSPIFVNSQSTSTIINSTKTKNANIKSSFQSTFV